MLAALTPAFWVGALDRRAGSPVRARVIPRGRSAGARGDRSQQVRSEALSFALHRDKTVSLCLGETKKASVGPCSACQIIVAAIMQQINKK